jgi:uncharacterized protein YgiM (DUF1202 family)
MKKDDTNIIESEEPVIEPANETTEEPATAPMYGDNQLIGEFPVPEFTPTPVPAPQPDAEKEEEQKVVFATVGTSKLNLRERPNKDLDNVLLVLSKGEQVEVISTAQGWAKVCTVDGLKGYVMKEYIEEA